MSNSTYTLLYDRPLVYVAGPYMSPDPVVNTHNTIKVADRLNEEGTVTCFVPHLTLLWHIVCPHGANNDQTYWYEYDLTMLGRCDAVLRLPGVSTGADAEVVFATDRHIPVFNDETSLLNHFRVSS